ncbi:MAG: hypothetical protein L6R19_14335 [Alphaproteobacteria bacterium]|nr:hypothetical protein [Alphaproteobacteria bacterium]
MTRIAIDQARAAKAKLKRELETRGIVAAIGLTKIGDDYCLKLNLRFPESARLPDTVDGVTVIKEVVGPIRKRAV